MIVVAIISLITTIGTHSYRRLRLEAQADAFINELKIIEAAVRMHYYDNNGVALASNAENLKAHVLLQPYFPPGFSNNATTPLGGAWRFQNTVNSGGIRIVCDGIPNANLPALELAREKMIRENPCN